MLEKNYNHLKKEKLRERKLIIKYKVYANIKLLKSKKNILYCAEKKRLKNRTTNKKITLQRIHKKITEPVRNNQ